MKKKGLTTSSLTVRTQECCGAEYFGNPVRFEGRGFAVLRHSRLVGFLNSDRVKVSEDHNSAGCCCQGHCANVVYGV